MSYPEVAPGTEGAIIRSLYEASGVFVFRDLLTPEDINTLQLIASLSYSIGDVISAILPADQLTIDISDGLIKRGYISWTRMASWLATLAPTLNTSLFVTIKKLESVACEIYGGEIEVKLLEGFSVMRRQRKVPRAVEQTTVPWHRDFSFVGPAGILHSTNFWIPLMDVGEHAPSLEVIIGSHNVMKHVPDDNPGITNIEEAWITNNLGDLPRWVPLCKPGDILIFDHQTIHRTQVRETPALSDRTNFETRWAPQV